MPGTLSGRRHRPSTLRSSSTRSWATGHDTAQDRSPRDPRKDTPKESRIMSTSVTITYDVFVNDPPPQDNGFLPNGEPKGACVKGAGRSSGAGTATNVPSRTYHGDDLL